MNERIGDLLRAWRVLGVRDDEGRRRVAARLGIAWEPARAADDDADDADGPDDDAFDAWFDEPPAEVSRPSTSEPEMPPPTPPSSDAPAQRSRLVPKARAASDAPAWWDGPARLPDAPSDVAALGPEPLLDPRRTRSLLATSMSSPAPFGEVDVAAIVDVLARGGHVADVPRRDVPSLARGCQLLVDRGAGMLPFRRDVDGLIADARAVVGADRLDLRWFDGCPEHGVGRYGGDADEPWAPTAFGAPVVCVSDVGIATPPGRRASSPGAWRRFAARVVKSGGRRPIVWVPYAASRWPDELRGALSLATWDRAATARRLGALLREGAR